MDALKKFVADGGLKSRKLWFGVGCVLLLAAMVLLAAHYAALVGLYDAFVGGVVTIYGTYAGVNVANRWGTAKHLGKHLDKDDCPKGDDDAPPPRSDS